jgi:uncharacterized protein YabN with tetrapyrrole methylase and pyrophosphatase domain
VTSVRRAPAGPGSLVVVGTGISLGVQTTTEAVACMRSAERLFYVVSDPAHAEWVRRMNPSAVSLQDCYAEGKPRQRTYAEMAERIVDAVRAGFQTCAAFYGHPGVFVNPGHEAIRRARAEGHSARMLPGISTEDCLFADLGVDPGDVGCQSFEATDFLALHRRFDPCSSLVLWQVGALGEQSVRPKMASRPERVQVLARALLRHYPARHRVTVYQAAQFPICNPNITRIPLSSLPRQRLTPAMTLYVPPLPQRPQDPRIARWFRA